MAQLSIIAANMSIKNDKLNRCAVFSVENDTLVTGKSRLGTISAKAFVVVASDGLALLPKSPQGSMQPHHGWARICGTGEKH